MVDRDDQNTLDTSMKFSKNKKTKTRKMKEASNKKIKCYLRTSLTVTPG